MYNEAKITYDNAIDSSNIIIELEKKKSEITKKWEEYSATLLSAPDEIISEKLKKLFGNVSTEATATTSNSLYSLVHLTLDHDFLRISNHDGGDKNLKNQMKNTPNIVIHDFQFINGGTDSYNDDVLQLNSPVHGVIECLRETIVINGNHLFVLNDVLALLDSIIEMIKKEGHTFHMPFVATENVQNNAKRRILIKESKLRQIIRETIREMLYRA